MKNIGYSLVFPLLLYSIFLILYSAPTAHAATISKPANNLGLVGYWSFDDATSTTATDFSGQANHGSFSGAPTWTTGKRGTALEFDGSDDYVNIPNASTLNPTTVTVSAWAYFDSLADRPHIVGKGTGAGGAYWLVIETSGQARFYYNKSGGGWSNIGESSASITSGRWIHFVGVYDGTKAYIYVDSVERNSVTNAGTLTTLDTNPVRVARQPDDSDSFSGEVDEVRIYNRALSPTEITRLYNAGAVAVKAPTKTGLVGAWNFDEGSGSQAGDTSGNGYTGTITDGTWVDGKHGKAIDFNGSSSYVSFTNNVGTGSNKISVAAWIKIEGSGSNWPRIILGGQVNDTYTLTKKNTTDDGLLWRPVGGGDSFFSATTLERNVWYHVVGTYDGDLGSDNVKIYINGGLDIAYDKTGNVPDDNSFGGVIGGETSAHSGGTASWFDGPIDDVRVYNRTLTAAEVQALYESSTIRANVNTAGGGLDDGLVGYWSFNGHDMYQNVADGSGNGNTGYLIGQTATTSVIGKVGQALEFNGSADYVNVGTTDALNITSAITLSAWFKSSHNFGSENNWGAIVSRMKNTSAFNGYEIGVGGSHDSASNKAYFHVGGTYASNGMQGTTAVNDGQWHQITGVYDGTNAYLYVDGTLQNSGARTNNLSISGEQFDIGNNYDRTTDFTGTIDEVRVYNRALSAAEVLQLYNAGK